MRRVTFALLLLLPALAFAATPATLESRSQQHALTVDVVPIGDSVEYMARVTDIASGELLATAKFTPDGGFTESVSQVRDMRIAIVVRPTYNGVTASMSIQRGETIVDSIESRWTLRPGRARTPMPANALRVGGDVKAPIVVQRVNPVYPVEARAARVSGIVILEVLIDKNGDVRDANVLKPLPFGLDQAAIDAVRQWKFKPATKNGEPVDVIFNLTVNFKIDAKPLKPPVEPER